MCHHRQGLSLGPEDQSSECCWSGIDHTINSHGKFCVWSLCTAIWQQFVRNCSVQLARVAIHGFRNSPLPATMVITQVIPRQLLLVFFVEYRTNLQWPQRGSKPRKNIYFTTFADLQGGIATQQEINWRHPPNSPKDGCTEKIKSFQHLQVQQLRMWLLS